MKTVINSLRVFSGKVKTAIMLFLLLLFTTAGFAMESLFPVNDKGKITFQETVATQGFSEDALRLNMMHYALKATTAGNKKAAKPKLQRNILEKEFSFYVYNQGLFTPQIHGEIKFRLRLEIIDDAYHYTFHDFVFQYYSKNRYGVYAPVNGKYKALEEERFAGMQKTWDEHKALTLKVVENHIRALNREMQKTAAGNIHSDELALRSE